MVKIAVAGGNEFVVGFRLAGIKDTFEITGDAPRQLKELKSGKEAGIIIVDEKIIEGLNIQDKLELEASVDPVFIPISTKAEQDSLKRLIKKSIGVDLWK